MKKIICLYIISFLILSTVNVIALSPENCQGKKILYFSQLNINENDEFIELEIKGANSVQKKYNHYIVPTRIETFIFPLGTEIKNVVCSPKNIHKKILSKELVITPEPITLDMGSINKNIKEKKDPIAPSDWFEYDIGQGIVNNSRKVILKIQLFPIQYESSKNMIIWSEQMEVNIQYQISNKIENLYEDDYSLLIISPQEYSDELAPLILHKNSMNISTKTVTLDQIYDSIYFPSEGRDEAEKIKFFIKNAIEEWGITNVLLVGGRNTIPMREMHAYIEYFDVEEVYVSDLYYADIYNNEGNFESWDTNNNDIFGEYEWGDSHLTDEVDLYPDVNLGRLACIDEIEVETCVNKIINYETNKAFTKDWFTNLTLIGGDTFTGDNWKVDEGEYVNEVAMDILNGFIPEKIWASNGRLGGSYPSGVNEIIDVINKGCGFIDFSGHGDPYTWATHPNGDDTVWLPKNWGFLNSDLVKLNNKEKLPIVVIAACSTCRYDFIDNCFGWTFISNPNGGGIGVFGLTATGFAYGNGKKITQGFVEELTLNVFKTYEKNSNGDSVLTLGNLWSNALKDYIYPNMEVRDYATIESFQFFGDPTLIISALSKAPERPTKPSGETSIESGISYSYYSNTIDDDGDRIYYLFDWGDNKLSGWIGPYNSGEIVSAHHTWENKGSYQIRVKAKDENGIQSDWSEPLKVKMPKNKLINLIFNGKLIERISCLLQSFN